MEKSKIEKDYFPYIMLLLNLIVSISGLALFLMTINDVTYDGQLLMATGLTYFIAALIISITFIIVFPFKYEYFHRYIELTNEIPKNVQDLNKQQYVLINNPIRGQSIVYYDQNDEKQMIELNDNVNVNFEESNKNEIVLLVKKNYGLFKKINYNKAEVIVQANIYIKNNLKKV